MEYWFKTAKNGMQRSGGITMTQDFITAVYKSENSDCDYICTTKCEVDHIVRLHWIIVKVERGMPWIIKTAQKQNSIRSAIIWVLFLSANICLL